MAGEPQSMLNPFRLSGWPWRGILSTVAVAALCSLGGWVVVSDHTLAAHTIQIEGLRESIVSVATVNSRQLSDAIKNVVDIGNTRDAGQDTRLDQMSARVKVVEATEQTDVRTIADKIDRIVAALNETGKKLDVLNQKVEDLKERIPVRPASHPTAYKAGEPLPFGG